MQPDSPILANLVSRIGEIFHCEIGPPRSYVEIDGKMFPYSTISFVVIGKIEDYEVQVRLVEALFKFFQSTRKLVREENPRLIWRLTPHIEETSKRGKHRTMIRCRVALLDYDLSSMTREGKGPLPLGEITHAA